MNVTYGSTSRVVAGGAVQQQRFLDFHVTTGFLIVSSLILLPLVIVLSLAVAYIVQGAWEAWVFLQQVWSLTGAPRYLQSDFQKLQNASVAVLFGLKNFSWPDLSSWAHEYL